MGIGDGEIDIPRLILATFTGLTGLPICSSRDEKNEMGVTLTGVLGLILLLLRRRVRKEASLHHSHLDH